MFEDHITDADRTLDEATVTELLLLPDGRLQTFGLSQAVLLALRELAPHSDDLKLRVAAARGQDQPPQ